MSEIHLPSRVEVRSVEVGETEALAVLHMSAFERFYLTALGKRFLRRYYRRVIEYEGGLCLGAYLDGRLVGAVAGFVRPASFYRALRADRLRLGFAALPALVRDPRRAARFLLNYRRVQAATTAASTGVDAELASLFVHPSAGGRGTGARLVRAFVCTAGERGAERVFLTTDAANNDFVNRFYSNLGFVCDRTFEAQPGRLLNEYSMRITRQGEEHAR